MAKSPLPLRPQGTWQVEGATCTALYDPTFARTPDFLKERNIHVKMWDLGRGCGEINRNQELKNTEEN